MSDTIALSALRIDKANVRSIGAKADANLIASIEAHGVIQPLIVRANGSGHLVIEGGRRLDALNELAKAGKIAKDFPVPVVIHHGNEAVSRETSLAANIVRQAMHPVDEFRAFQALHVDKSQPLDVDAIARRFGISEKGVRQRLALGALDDAVLDAWKNDAITGEAAQAFTMSQSKKQQVAVLNQLRKQDNGRVDKWAVQKALNTADSEAKSKLSFVGQAEYEAAGGKVTVDLFGEGVVISDIALLQKCFEKKFEAKVQELKDAGWKFVLTEKPQNFYSYGHVNIAPTYTKDEKVTLKTLDAKITKIEQQEDDTSVEEDDALEALKDERDAIINAAELRAATPEVRAKSGAMIAFDRYSDKLEITVGLIEPKSAKAEAKGKDAKKAKGPATISQALRHRLRDQMLSATKAALTADKHGSKLDTLLANIVASTINASQPYGIPQQVEKNFAAIRAAITPKVMNEAQRKVFDGKDYFNGCGKTFCLAAIREAVGAAEAKKLEGKKGKELAAFAIGHVLKSKWLPKELRAAHYDGPGK